MTKTIEIPIEGMDYDWECRLVRFGREKILAMVRDITERKRAECLRDVQRDVAVALSGVSGLKDGYLSCLQTALRSSQMDCGGIYTLDRDTGDLHLVAHSGVSEEYVESVKRIARDSKAWRLAMEGEPTFASQCTLGIPLSPTQRREGLPGSVGRMLRGITSRSSLSRRPAGGNLNSLPASEYTKTIRRSIRCPPIPLIEPRTANGRRATNGSPVFPAVGPAPPITGKAKTKKNLCRENPTRTCSANPR